MFCLFPNRHCLFPNRHCLFPNRHWLFPNKHIFIIYVGGARLFRWRFWHRSSSQRAYFLKARVTHVYKHVLHMFCLKTCVTQVSVTHVFDSSFFDSHTKNICFRNTRFQIFFCNTRFRNTRFRNTRFRNTRFQIFWATCVTHVLLKHVWYML